MNTYQKHLRTRKQQKRRDLMQRCRKNGRFQDRLLKRLKALLNRMTREQLVAVEQRLLSDEGLRGMERKLFGAYLFQRKLITGGTRA